MDRYADIYTNKRTKGTTRSVCHAARVEVDKACYYSGTFWKSNE